jgi:hypothetical protein
VAPHQLASVGDHCAHPLVQDPMLNRTGLAEPTQPFEFGPEGGALARATPPRIQERRSRGTVSRRPSSAGSAARAATPAIPARDR